MHYSFHFFFSTLPSLGASEVYGAGGSPATLGDGQGPGVLPSLCPAALPSCRSLPSPGRTPMSTLAEERAGAPLGH